MDSALETMRTLLIDALPQEAKPVPLRGIHAILGASGTGKSLMTARLAHIAHRNLAAESIALVSYCDHRAGAWSQMQMLSAKVGVESFRARNLNTLQLLLDELQTRELILIDTPGAEFLSHAADLHIFATETTDHTRPVHLHGLAHADASIASLKRIYAPNGWDWSSLMVSKLDESIAPWPLIQALCDNTVPISVCAQGDQLSEGLFAYDPAMLVETGLASLRKASLHNRSERLPTAPQINNKPLPLTDPGSQLLRSNFFQRR